MKISKQNLLSLLTICVIGLVYAAYENDDVSTLMFGPDDFVEGKDFASDDSDVDIVGYEEHEAAKENGKGASYYGDHPTMIFEDYMTPKVESDDEVSLKDGEEYVNVESVPLQGPQMKFPLAIDSDVDLVRVSAVLTYCTYDKPFTSEDDCPAFLDQTCEKDSFNTLTFNSMNAVIVCKKGQRVFVSIAGTQNNLDGMSDLAFFSKTMNLPNKEKKVAHSGFVTRAEQYSLWVSNALSRIEGIDQMEIVFTGHSLGGALATLLPHDIYASLRLNVFGGATNGLNQVKVVTFGSPSVIYDPSGYFVGHLNHLRFHNTHDIVANHSAKLLKSISGFEHVGVELLVPNQQFLNVIKKDKKIQKQARNAVNVSQENQSEMAQPNRTTNTRSILALASHPADFWIPEQPIPDYNPFTLDSHAKLAYTVLAVPVFLEYQKTKETKASLLPLVNAAVALEKRLDSPVTCKLALEKVICVAKSGVVAKFNRTGYNGTDVPVDECMSLIVKQNAIPGITVNAGISLNDMSPNAVASEALTLDISTSDTWYRSIPPKIFNTLFMDGSSEIPEQCILKPTYLSYNETMPSERAMIRNSIERPSGFIISESNTNSSPIIQLIKSDMSFFGDQDHEGWMDCRSPSNQPFCPSVCQNDNDPTCSVMKKFSEEDGISYYVSIGGNRTFLSANNCQIVVKENKPKPYWFSRFRGGQVEKEAVINVIQE